MTDGGHLEHMMSMTDNCTRDSSSVGNCNRTLMIDDTMEVRISFFSYRNLPGVKEKVLGCLRLGRYFLESKSMLFLRSIVDPTSHTSLSIHVLREERSTAAGTIWRSQ